MNYNVYFRLKESKNKIRGGGEIYLNPGNVGIKEDDRTIRVKLLMRWTDHISQDSGSYLKTQCKAVRSEET